MREEEDADRRMREGEDADDEDEEDDANDVVETGVFTVSEVVADGDRDSPRPSDPPGHGDWATDERTGAASPDLDVDDVRVSRPGAACHARPMRVAITFESPPESHLCC